MRQILFVVISSLLFGGSQVLAQKAYDTIHYLGRVEGYRAQLELADGYLLASRITFNTKRGIRVFKAMAHEADKQGKLRFVETKPRQGGGEKTALWVELRNLDADRYSPKISAVYWNGTKLIPLVFSAYN
ncbi:hypothetical protein [Pedobacter sp. SYP-B3415]|uniref:hypothetical protein n=1 Tax=Pedobacter sp. SYP-B3415 TaxID=2496641 RepID=UPI00101B5E1C|nr:hypothetical protein [Pedobacter sp. SYP-B3415]